MNYYIYSDASVNQTVKQSIGCSIITNLDNYIYDQKDINVYTIKTTKSTEAELMTLILTLRKLHNTIKNPINLTIYTDCMSFKNIIEKHKDKNDLQKEIQLYNNIYNITVIWTKGHNSKDKQIERHQQIFSIIDKLVRKLSRNIN